MKKPAPARESAQKTIARPLVSVSPATPQFVTAPLHPLLRLQQTIGNQAVLRLLQGAGALQTKLRVGQPDDPYEQEADRVAEQVVSSTARPTLQRKCACEGGTPCPKCEEEGRVRIQRKVERASALEGNSVPDNFLDSLGPGQPLDLATRAFFEPRFGHDFSRVRVHADEKAAATAEAVAANAYTVGGHLVFGAGHYRPATQDGRQLIAHELTHVLQQGEEPIPARLDLGSAASPEECQADRLSREVLASSEFRETSSAAPATTDGRSHEPHELHAVQSKSGAAAGLIQRRRVPQSGGLGAVVPTGAPGLAIARTGLARVLSRAWGGLTAAEQTAVRTAVSGLGITWTTEADLLTKLSTATRPELLSFAGAIRTAVPSAELGDPLLIDTGARPGTADAAHITTLVSNADAVFATIAGGTKDADIIQVFGAANVATAKTKYANARTRMTQLKAADKIVTDRSGYSAEVSLGGLSNSSQIAVKPSTIDNPGDRESVVTLIHESMHAGNNDVHDFGYIHQPSFTALAASVKLTNAAHFEVVPRRILGASHAFTGQIFIPAGATVGGVTAPALTPRQQAIRGASETYRLAWTAGLNLHKLFVRLFRAPAEWNTLDLSTAFSGAPAGAHFADTLPFWSKVEMLTIHTRAASINPAGAPAVRPVTLIDVALSEGLIRKLSQGMNSVPQTEPAALAFETAHASAAERTAAAASVNAERDLLIRLVIRVGLGSITGAVSRDERVVGRLAQAASSVNYTDYLQVRPPSAFP